MILGLIILIAIGILIKFLIKSSLYVLVKIFIFIVIIPVILLNLLFLAGNYRTKLVADEHISICISNLKEIGIACNMYAQDYNSKFPDNLTNLYPKYTSRPVFLYPDAYPREQNQLSTNFSEQDIAYQYTKGLTETSPKTSILAHCKPGNHVGGIINVLYVDGHVETTNEL